MASKGTCKRLRTTARTGPWPKRPKALKPGNYGLEFHLQGTTLIHIFPALIGSGYFGEFETWHG